MRIALRILVALCAMCCFALAQDAVPSASEQILDFHSDIHVQDDASLQVRETIRVRSTGVQIHHGIYRDFPTRYRDRLGNPYLVGFKVVEVSRDGESEKFHVEDQGKGERIYLGDENVILPPGEYTYTLVYTATREIGFFPDHDELYWNVTGTGWLFPIAHASTTVTLPDYIPAAGIRVDGYTGPPGARGKAFTHSIGTAGAVSFESTQLLPPGEGLTIVVSWSKGYLQQPSGDIRFRYFLEDNRPTLVGAAGLILVLLYFVMVWFGVGRGPAKSSIMPIYEPPAGVSPAAMRYLVRMGFDEKTFAVVVIDMAVKKFLSIKENDGLFALQQRSSDQKPLASEESAAADILFHKSRERAEPVKVYSWSWRWRGRQAEKNSGRQGDGRGKRKEQDDVDAGADDVRRSAVALRPSNSEIGEAVKAVKKSLHDAEDKIYFVTNRRYWILGLILSAAVVVAIVAAAGPDRDDWFGFGFICVWLTVWSFVVFFLARNAVRLWRGARAGGSMVKDLRKQARSATLYALVFGVAEIAVLYMLASGTSIWIVVILVALPGTNLAFHRLLKAPTRAGRDLLDKVEGFRMFLQAVDGDRLNRLMPPDKTPELFEKYLPYAVALDSEQAWSQQFDAVLEQARQTTGYSPAWYVGNRALTNFAPLMSAGISNAIAASASAPGSSSGVGGGGFSGGGGGGGGGGGW